MCWYILLLCGTVVFLLANQVGEKHWRSPESKLDKLNNNMLLSGNDVCSLDVFEDGDGPYLVLLLQGLSTSAGTEDGCLHVLGPT